MHFSKTYTQLLLSLPPELRDNAIQYRQLKKVINQIVIELSALGLKPAVLQELIEGSSGPGFTDTSTSPTPSFPSSRSSSVTSILSTSTPEPTHISEEEQNGPTSEQEDKADRDTDLTSPSPSHHPANGASSQEAKDGKLAYPRVVYELNSTSGKIEPQLRIWINVPPTPVSAGVGVEALENGNKKQNVKEGVDGNDAEEEREDDLESSVNSGHTSLLWSFQQRHFGGDGLRCASIVEVDSDLKNGPQIEGAPESSGLPQVSSTRMHEVVIPLVHDTEFYSMLSTTLGSISTHLTEMHAEFVNTLEGLSRMISDTAHPASVAQARFQPLSSVTTNPGAIRVRAGELKSDLYFWREIFRLYLEAEVFESMGESTRGEWSVEESEKRLQLFAERVTKQGLGDRRKFKMKQSLQALETFLSMNLFILNVKKFSHANSEATRKILKKHAKRTALFYPGLEAVISPTLPTDSAPTQPLLALVPHSTPFSFPRILVQAVGETLLPIIPSLEDYSCLICTSIAFKPIRLSCGHLFCVRCLVKMQKRNQGDCPMCRTPSVLIANRGNVDWALLNFMQDWFPVEAREKLKSNEKEATEEQLRELGVDPNQSCLVM